ncbi:trifunctional dihydropteroate synthetase [Sorochytrium milnesiophthora]
MDIIAVRDLRVHCITGVDHWEKAKRQPLDVSFSIRTDVGAAGEYDLLANSVSYSALSKTVSELAEKSRFRTLEALSTALAAALVRDSDASEVTVKIEKPRSLLRAAATGVEIVRRRRQAPQASATGNETSTSELYPSPDADDVLFIRDLVLSAIIGVNPWEREERQNIIINLSIFHPDGFPESGDVVTQPNDYRTIARLVEEYVQESSFKTVEALCHHVARLCIERCNVSKVTVRIEKPSALVFAKTAGVEVTRDREWLRQLKAKQNEYLRRRTISVASTGEHMHTAYIAMGSNLGDRAGHIHAALFAMTQDGQSRIVNTSFLYETAPMYVTDQPMFLNAVCKIATSHEPHSLLKTLKSCEENAGRTDTGRNGPRPIDLDILFYDNVELNTDTLIIPHPRIQEREFVLRPLCDIAPDLHHPVLFRTMAKLLALLPHSSAAPSDPMRRVFPIAPGKVWTLASKTYIMGILNVTPDSFSDGGQYDNIERAVAHAREMVAAGADIIDIGGQSTRPGAVEVSEQEELARVLPVIQAIRKDAGLTVPLSIDTYRAAVAKAAVEAGVNLINDVSGGTRDPHMLEVMATTRAPVCLMHMRGDANTMTRLTQYAEGNVVLGVTQELEELVARALQANIPRWNVLVDPGIGFAKDAEQNFDVLRRLRSVTDGTLSRILASLPLLVGPSRKRFIGSTIGAKQPDSEPGSSASKPRVWGTAAAVTACIAGGADVVRVHDVAEMSDVAKIADRVWRS